jgi:hypothetical protein
VQTRNLNSAAPPAHHKLAGDIRRLIHQEQYAEAQELLPDFAQAVVEVCNKSEQEHEFLQAKQFLQSAVIAVKARQAHYLTQLEDLGRHRAYVGAPDRKPGLDFVG